ncbi:hypothetical protein ISCGN_026909 [Ixodes scapularis]
MGLDLGRHDKGGDELVQCEGCGRWCYLEETGFGSLEVAAEVSFECRLCVKLQQVTGEWEGRVREIEAQLKAEGEKRVGLEAQVEELTRQLNHEREQRVGLEKQAEELGEVWKAGLEERKRECDSRVERLEGVIRASESSEGRKEEVSVLAGRTASLQAGVPGGRESGLLAGGLDDAGELIEPQLNGAFEQQASGSQVTGDKSQDKGAQAPGGSRVLVVGSSNVARVRRGVHNRVKGDQRVTVKVQPGKCMVDAMTAAREGVWDNREGRNLVIVHAGLNDVLKGRSQNLGKQLNVGIRKLRDVSENVHVVVCTIPEVRGQSGLTERRVVEANGVIKGMSRQLRYDVMEVNREVYEAGSRPFADGIHYSEATGYRASGGGGALPKAPRPKMDYVEVAGGRTGNRKPRQRHRKQRQQPALPREDIKIILRPREGLDVTKVSSARLRDGVFCAIGLKEQDAEGDLLRVNPEKNIIVTSTPSMDRAKKYNPISKICIADKTYEVTAYAAPPEDTAKGVIHNIPDYDTAEDITRSLVYNKNPTILQAQRMGKTNSAVIVFEGNTVPYYVYYRGAEYRCFLHKKKHEVCSTCGKVGHRMDVCPTPEDKICRSCGTKNPREGHKCDPKCALCCGDHPTGDKNCKNRFQTPYLLWKRQREKERQNGAGQYGGHRNAESTSVLGGGEGGGRTKERGTRDRSGSFPRLPHRGSGSDNDAGQRQQRRSRSKSRGRSPNTQGRHQSRSTSRGRRHETPGGTKQNKDPVLFAGTLRWNLDPFDEHSDDAVWKALEQAHLKDHVVGEGLGLDYDIAEGGDNLSAGQRQLVCLARALLRQSKVLILDEATSSVDLATDQLVKETIHSEFQSTTMITIAHKLHTVMDCDKILVLAAGEVLEQGTPKELLEIKNGHFFTMARDAGVA